MAKLFLILALGGALANGLSPRQPPLLIEDTTAATPLDAAN